MPSEHHPLPEALERFYRRTTEGIRPGLEIIRGLLDRLGQPEASLATVHVAGTNGKGSVCAMIEAVLRASGLRTGLYTSPHLVAFNERVRVDGRSITDEDLLRHLQGLEIVADALAGDPGRRNATFFEMGTALAFEHFREKEVDVAVLETGMGGRWDATNVTVPLVSVITRIDMDHMNYLGATIEEIAAEKSGIIKRGRPVVCGPMREEARGVVLATAADEGAPVIRAEEAVSVCRMRQDLDGQRIAADTACAHYGPLVLPLIGRHQVENVSMAIAALEAAMSALEQDLEPAAVKAGLEGVRWPARCQVLGRDPVVLLDGAHNPCGARSLDDVLGEVARGMQVGLVGGFLRDKDGLGFMRILAPRLRRCWAVPVASERAMSADEAAAAMRAAGVEDVTVSDSVAGALEQGRAWARENGALLCIAGSLYLAGEVLGLETPGPLFG